jgi:uncharacterized protein YuzE
VQIRYDAEVDALSIVFRDVPVTTRELAEGLVGEFDAAGKLVGLEILDAVKHFGDATTVQRVELEGVALQGIPPGVSPGSFHG